VPPQGVRVALHAHLVYASAPKNGESEQLRAGALRFSRGTHLVSSAPLPRTVAVSKSLPLTRGKLSLRVLKMRQGVVAAQGWSDASRWGSGGLRCGCLAGARASRAGARRRWRGRSRVALPCQPLIRPAKASGKITREQTPKRRMGKQH